MSSAILLMVAALGGLTGCGQVQDGNVLAGWSFDWADLSHRVPYVSVDMSDAGEVQMGLIGGDWSTGDQAADTVNYSAETLLVSSNRAAFASQEITLTIEPAGEGSGFEASGEVVFDEDAVGDWRDYTAFISGFTLNTDVADQPDGYSEEYDPGLGYTSHGFGVTLGEVEDGAVPVTVRFEHGPSHEEDVPNISEGREAMDASIPFARTEARVRVTLVGFKGDREDLSFSEAAALEYDPPYSDQEFMSFAASTDAKDAAVPGWRSFDLVVNGDEDQGDYLRGFGVTLSADALDAGLSGEVTAGVTGTSLFELAPMTVDFSAELAVLHLGGDTTVTRSSWAGEGQDVGDWSAEAAR